MMYKIDVDEEIWSILKKHAEPFEDTPNSVLRRLLPINTGAAAKTRDFSSNPFERLKIPVFPSSVPVALQQILEVVFLVKKLGHSRTDATNIIARERKIASQTVIDKYCRQLNMQAYEFDRLLEQDVDSLRVLLEKQFTNHHDIIQNIFGLL